MRPREPKTRTRQIIAALDRYSAVSNPHLVMLIIALCAILAFETMPSLLVSG